MFLKHIIHIVLIWGVFCHAGFAQAAAGSKGSHYAVVAGISEYQSKSITALHFAERDAMMFAAFLNEGTNPRVLTENTRLFIGKNATVGALTQSLDWLQQVCRAGDTAWFYFSGHGDIETRNSSEQGYLLAWNSPPNNYANNALSVARLNAVARQLSAVKKVQVVIITDACHSGTLAGDLNKGKEWVAQQLSIARPGELRIASCRADEEAQEGESWGGGRGIFSFYFLQALQGTADYNADGTVVLEEAAAFVDSAVRNDPYLKAKGIRQHPQIKGIPVFPVATGIQKRDAQAIATRVRVLPQSPIDKFFDLLEAQQLESLLAETNLTLVHPDSIAAVLVKQLLPYPTVSPHFLTTSQVEEIQYVRWIGDELKALFSRSTVAKNQFFARLVVTIHNRAQEAINAYLAGDLAELNKRQYYYTGSQGYGALLALIQFALKLAVPGDELRRFLELQNFYLHGLQARMKLITSPNPGPVLHEALAWQRRALKIDPYNAAYIQNELGILQLRKRSIDSAKMFLSRASAIAPTWALPWTNTISLQLARNNLPLAEAAAGKAKALQPGLPYAMVNEGLVRERQGNYLEAEALYLKAIAINEVHFFPFERLGHVYLLTGRLDMASHYFKEAEIRKRDLGISGTYYFAGMEAGGDLTGFTLSKPPVFGLPDNILAKFPESARLLFKGMASFCMDIFENAIPELLSALSLQPELPGAHHFIGASLFNMADYAASIPYFAEAAKRKISADSALKFFAIPTADFTPDEWDMVVAFIEKLDYTPAEDYFFAGAAAEKTGMNNEAISFYKNAYRLELKEAENIASYETLLPGFTEETLQQARISEDRMYNFYENPAPCISCLKISSLLRQEGRFEEEELFLLQNYEDAKALSKKRLLRNIGAVTSERATASMYYRIFRYPMRVLVQAEASLFQFYSAMQEKNPGNGKWFRKGGLYLFRKLNYLYDRVDPVWYGYLTERVRVVDFPWDGKNWSEGQHRPKGADSVVYYRVPGTMEILSFSFPAIDPVETAYALLQRSVQLEQRADPAPEIWEGLARLAHWQGKKEEAMQFYRYYLQVMPTDTNALKGWMELAMDSMEYSLPYAYLRNNPQSVLAKELRPFLYTAALYAGNFKTADSLQRHLPQSFLECALWLRWFRMLRANQWQPVLTGVTRALRTINADTVSVTDPIGEEIIHSPFEKLYLYKSREPFGRQMLQKLNTCNDRSKEDFLYLLARTNIMQGKAAEAFRLLQRVADGENYLPYYWLVLHDPLFNRPQNRAELRKVIRTFKSRMQPEDEEPSLENISLIVFDELMVPYVFDK